MAKKAWGCRTVLFLRFSVAAGNIPTQDPKLTPKWDPKSAARAPKRTQTKHQHPHQHQHQDQDQHQHQHQHPAPSTQHPAPAPAPRRCAAVPAQRFESAAHPCLQGVAERMGSGVPGWNIRSGTLSREIGVPTGTAHSADPFAPTGAYQPCFAVKNDQKTIKNSTPMQPQALLAKQASPVSARYTR